MEIFYYDEEIERLEKQLALNEAIRYIEQKFIQDKREDQLCALIGMSWYYFIEGEVNQNPKDYDWKELLDCWEKYVTLGLTEYSDCQAVQWIICYTLSLHGEIYLSTTLCIQSKEILQTLAQNTLSPTMKILVDYVLHSVCSLSDDAKKIVVVEVFKSSSILDNYFREMFTANVKVAKQRLRRKSN